MNRHDWNIKSHLANMQVGQGLAICSPEKTYVLRLEEVRITDGVKGLEPAMIWIDEIKDVEEVR